MTGDMTLIRDMHGALIAMKNLHDRSECEDRGRGCWVHAASEHPLNSAPIYWDEARRRAYRKCDHGFHRDPDDYDHQSRYEANYVGKPSWCDGPACECCPAHSE